MAQERGQPGRAVAGRFPFDGEEVFATRDDVTGDVVLSDRPGARAWRNFFDALDSACYAAGGRNISFCSTSNMRDSRPASRSFMAASSACNERRPLSKRLSRASLILA